MIWVFMILYINNLQEQSSSGVTKRFRVKNFMILSVVVTISMSDSNGFHKTHWFYAFA